MTNLSELKAKYAALGAEIERLEAKPAVNDGPLTEAPEKGANYWYLNSYGPCLAAWWNDSADRRLFTSGNTFHTREAAEQKLRTIIAKHAPGWRADWEDGAQEKGELCYNHMDGKWVFYRYGVLQTPGTIYFPPELFDTILSEMGEAMEDLL